MKRFYYFGCSFTSHSTPTWGDMIAIDLINHHGYDYAVNRGRGGACNKFILSELLYILDTENISEQDKFGVCWTTIHRDSFLGRGQNDHPDSNEVTWCTGGTIFQGPYWAKLSNHDLVHCDYEMVYQTLLSRNIFHRLAKPTYEYRAYLNPFDNYDWGTRIKLEDMILDEKVLPDHYAGLYDLIQEQFESYSQISQLRQMTKQEHWPFEDSENPDHYNYHPDWWHCKHQDTHPDVYLHFELAKRQHKFHPDTEKLIWDYHKMMSGWMRKVGEYKPKSGTEWRLIYNDVAKGYDWKHERQQYGIRNGWIK